MNSFSLPVHNQSKSFENLHAKIQNFDNKLNDLHSHTEHAISKASDAQALNDANNNSKVVSTVEKVKNLQQDSNRTLEDAQDLLRNATALLGDSREAFDNLFLEVQQGQDAREKLNETLETNQLELYEVQQPVRRAEEHALKLEAKVSCTFSILCPLSLCVSLLNIQAFVFECSILRMAVCNYSFDCIGKN
jgi:chromosome segregation ATPase